MRRNTIISVVLALLVPAAVIAAVTGISTQQTRTAAPATVQLSGVTASEGTSLAHARADHVHSVTIASSGTELPGKIMRESIVGFTAYITSDTVDCYPQRGYNATTYPSGANCSRVWAGNYTVTFTHAFSTIPICTISSGTLNRIINIHTITKTSVGWFTLNNAGISIDGSSFYIICVGS